MSWRLPKYTAQKPSLKPQPLDIATFFFQTHSEKSTALQNIENHPQQEDADADADADAAVGEL